MRSPLPLTLLLFAAAAPAVLSASCNGSPDLCARKYSNVSFAGAHDASFVGLWLADNQYDSVATQLDLGIRFMEVQAHLKDDVIELCHTNCVLEDSGSLADFLTTIKTWMDTSGNENEVLSLLITSGDGAAVSQFGDVFASVGLDTYAYAPGGTLGLDDWPTLQELIAAGTRLVVWKDYDADTSSVPYILDEFAYYFETPFDVTDDAKLDACDIDRPSGASADGRMYIINHFLDVDFLGVDIPDYAALDTTNSIASILAQANNCSGLYGRYPNIVLLDFVNAGDPIGAEDELNGVTSS